MAAQVVEVEPPEVLAKPGPLNYLVEVDPLEDLTTSTDYRHKQVTSKQRNIFSLPNFVCTMTELF